MQIVNRVQNLFGTNPFHTLNSLLLQEVHRHQSALDHHVRGSQNYRAWVTEQAVHFEIDLPGRQPGDFEVSLEKDTVNIAVGPASAQQEGNSNFVLRERSADADTFLLKLPFRASPEGITTTYSCGILKLTATMPEEDLPRKLEVRAGE